MRLRGRAGEQLRRRILARDGHRCRDCGQPGKLEVHHETALRHGGSNTPGNLRTLCVSCHLARHRREEDAGWRELVEALLEG